MLWPWMLVKFRLDSTKKASTMILSVLQSDCLTGGFDVPFFVVTSIFNELSSIRLNYNLDSTLIT